MHILRPASSRATLKDWMEEGGEAGDQVTPVGQGFSTSHCRQVGPDNA